MKTAKLMLIAALGVSGTMSCAKKSESSSEDLSMLEDTSLRTSSTATDDPAPEQEKEEDDRSGGTGAAMALDEGQMGKRDSSRTEGQYKMSKNAGNGAAAQPKVEPVTTKTAPKKPDGKKGGDKDAIGGNAEEVTTRAWFPETFLWQPLVVTDDTGAATVPVRVPDRLTTWHVLALAHTRAGAQGGAVASFLGTLPAYVDLVVPPFLIVGDEINLPVQVVNTTAEAITAPLVITAENAVLGSAGGTRTIPAGGNLVEYVTVKAARAGTVKIKAQIGTTDAVLRTIDVLPAGRPVVTNRSGTLAAPRTLSITGPADSDPTTDRARLVVYPGALALLRSELSVSTARDGVADHAYALLLAGRAPQLLASLGDKADPEAIRNLAIIAGQKIMRDARTLDVTTATLIVEAALAHANNPVMARLAERAVAHLAKEQRPDGSFGGADGWTPQRLLINTAEGARAVSTDTGSTASKQRAQGVIVRASGMFERNFARIEDGYTAAAVLATGALSGELVNKLRAKVIESIKDAGDGAKYLDVPAGVVRADDSAPSRAEATAYAILALQGDPKSAPLLADLGSTLLGSYDPGRGWGDGRANLVAMRAVLELFKTPIPSDVRITLQMDGKEVASGSITKAAVRDVLALEASAPGIAGTHEWKLVAEPAVPGLGYALVLNSWVPWAKETTNHGLELQLPASVTGTVGKPIEIAIAAIAPAGANVHITQALPAGMQLDTPSLQKLVTDGTIQRFDTSDGKLELFVPAMTAGQTFAAKYRLIPTLAGTLHSAASKIEMSGYAFHVQPTEWVIK